MRPRNTAAKRPDKPALRPLKNRLPRIEVAIRRFHLRELRQVLVRGRPALSLVLPEHDGNGRPPIPHVK